jgi:polyhydroxyalkanoate synthesis regulator phasin
VREAAKGYLALAGSLTQVTRERATAAARALVAQGGATAEQVSSLVDDVLEQSRQNREAVTALVRYEVERALARLGLGSDDEVRALVERIRALEADVRRLTRAAEQQRPAGAAPVERAPSAGKAEKAPARRASSAGKAPAKRAPARRASSAGKAPAKKAPATKGPAADKAPATSPKKASTRRSATTGDT